jgi:hypothetical protein
MKTFILIVIIGPLWGCNPSPQTSPATIKGHYTWGAEVNTFTPCGSEKTLWVVGESSILSDLEKKYSSITKKPYEKTFAIVSGNILDKDLNSDGFDADYDGRISIESIQSHSASSDKDCN